jgi:hypothetical protein
MKNPTTYYKQWDNLVLIKTSFTKEAIVFLTILEYYCITRNNFLLIRRPMDLYFKFKYTVQGLEIFTILIFLQMIT